MKGLLSFIIFILYGNMALCQSWSFGLQLSATLDPSSTKISCKMDSFSIESFDALEGMPSIGLFVNHDLGHWLNVRVELNYFASYTPYKIFYRYKRDFLNLPISQAASISHNTIELPLTIRLNLPARISNFEIGVLAGFSTHFMFNPYGVRTPLPLFEEHQGLIDQIENGAKPVKIVPSYGVYAVLFNRVDISLRYSRLNNYLRDVKYQGNTYHIDSSAEYFWISVGYRFYSLRLHQRKKKHADPESHTSL
jgi:hypothetical protein